MTKKAFDRIAAGLGAAIDYAEGRVALDGYRVHLPPIDVVALRRRLELSQSDFAARYAFAIEDVQEWEKGSRPEGPMRAYLRVIEFDPDAVARALNVTEQTAA